MATERPRRRRGGRGLLLLLVLLLIAGALVFYLLGGRINVDVTNPNVDVSPGRLPDVNVGQSES
jgi:hypothetical protein